MSKCFGVKSKDLVAKESINVIQQHERNLNGEDSKID